jgi:hypothetical protein
MAVDARRTGISVITFYFSYLFYTRKSPLADLKKGTNGKGIGDFKGDQSVKLRAGTGFH